MKSSKSTGENTQLDEVLNEKTKKLLSVDSSIKCNIVSKDAKNIFWRFKIQFSPFALFISEPIVLPLLYGLHAVFSNG